MKQLTVGINQTCEQELLTDNQHFTTGNIRKSPIGFNTEKSVFYRLLRIILIK